MKDLMEKNRHEKGQGNSGREPPQHGLLAQHHDQGTDPAVEELYSAWAGQNLG